MQEQQVRLGGLRCGVEVGIVCAIGGSMGELLERHVATPIYVLLKNFLCEACEV